MSLDALSLISKYGADNIDLWADAAECEKDLSTFYRRAWATFDPAPYEHAWYVDAICDHLMLVSDGEIKKLLINIPFRMGKTSIVSVAWPAWVWAQSQKAARMGPQVSFLCLSYAATLSQESATKMRRLVASDWYQKRWGHRVQIAKDQDNKEKFDTTAKGSRISVGFDGGTMGRGGDIKIIDDPHKIKELESEDVRLGTLRTYSEGLSSRFTDPETSAEVIVMQRLHEDDLSGHVIEKKMGHVHLCLPMEYDPARHCKTFIGSDLIWQDPRTEEGELLWPNRFTRDVVDDLKSALGPYGSAGQLQQIPAPRGGGIIKTEWWKLWPAGAFPDFRSVLVSVDTAQTEKEQNDESGITVWGVFDAPDDEDFPQGMPLIMLLNSWEGRLEFDNLVQKIAAFCKGDYGKDENGQRIAGPKADVCLIEGKSNGIDVINELKRRFGTREWATRQFDPKTDKFSRLLSVQAIWSGEFKVDPRTGNGRWFGGVVYAPDKDYAQLVIDRVAAFPHGRRKALADTTSQAMIYMRSQGWVLTREEHQDNLDEELAFKKPRGALYDV